MGIFSRFTFNQQGSQLHSSGLSANDETLGSTSAQSFEQRKAIEQNRRLVGGYRDAAVIHHYRHSARVTPRAEVPEENQQIEADHRTSKTIPRTSQITNRPTSRIDNATSTRGVPPAVKRTMPAQFRPLFREPESRGYNPYK